MSIGLKLPNETLVLTRGRDFQWVFVNLDDAMEEAEFPAGELLIVFPEIEAEWPFTIDGTRASIKVESEDVDLIPNRALFHLVWMPEDEEAGGEAIAVGRVVVQGAA